MASGRRGQLLQLRALDVAHQAVMGDGDKKVPEEIGSSETNSMPRRVRNVKPRSFQFT